MKISEASAETFAPSTWLPSNGALIWTFVAIGSLLRLREYLFNRSLWYDESMLALNIINRSPTDLTKPLSYFQVAPIGFLWLEKLSVHYLGSSEMALRLVPLLSGIVSIFLFAAVARHFLSTNVVPIAVGLFSISQPLIYYSAEAKQYSTDVALTLLLYLLLSPFLEASVGFVHVILVALIGAVIIWCSHPAVFVLAGVALSVLWTAARRRDSFLLILTVIPAAVWACSFLLFYTFSLRRASNDPILLDYWKDAFMPLPPSSLADLSWFESAFFKTFSFPVGLAATGIAAVAATLGTIELRARSLSKFLSLLLPIVLALLASSMHLYPFQGRLLLFLVPSLLILVAAGFDLIKCKTWKAFPLLNTLLLGFLLFAPLAEAARHLVKPRGLEEIKPVVKYVGQHMVFGDTLYCYYGAEPAFEYYRERGLIAPIKQLMGVKWIGNLQLYKLDSDKLRGQKRVWVLFSHVSSVAGVDEEIFFVDHLDQVGRRLDTFHTTGASVYLYDLRSERDLSSIPGFEEPSVRTESAK